MLDEGKARALAFALLFRLCLARARVRENAFTTKHTKSTKSEIISVVFVIFVVKLFLKLCS